MPDSLALTQSVGRGSAAQTTVNGFTVVSPEMLPVDEDVGDGSLPRELRELLVGGQIQSRAARHSIGTHRLDLSSVRHLVELVRMILDPHLLKDGLGVLAVGTVALGDCSMSVQKGIRLQRSIQI